MELILDNSLYLAFTFSYLDFVCVCMLLAHAVREILEVKSAEVARVWIPEETFPNHMTKAGYLVKILHLKWK